MNSNMTLDEKKELVVMHYRDSYDLEIAMMLAELTEPEKQFIKRDASFMYRISYEDAKIKKKIIGVLLSSMDSEDEKLARTAAVDLGKILDKERFVGGQEKPKGTVPDIINLVGKKPE